MSGAAMPDCDVAFVGGGLANGLAAYRLAAKRPELRIRLFEAGDMIGGNHTWSFHDGDLTAAEHEWMQPFVVHRWPGYAVRFPERRRGIATSYRSVTSERFREVVVERLAGSIETDTVAATVTPDEVTLTDGRKVRASCVVDGRGHAPSRHLRLGFQKFLGQEIELDAPHGLAIPVIMDATVPQQDGYRFVYTLPLSATCVLVEDTYYADGADLDPERLRASIAAYLASKGWRGAMAREERGVLPIALGGDIQAFWAEKAGVPTMGLAAALFHPTTGYSLPDAVRTADLMAQLPDLSAPSVFAAIRDHSIRTWKARGFFRMLNRMLFLAGASMERYRVLQHFYRLPEPLIARFYAADLRTGDKIRILTGRPPVPVRSALRVLAGHRLSGAVA